MGVFKDVSESMLKYGEKLANKTEEYSKILKRKLDIKRIEGEIEKIHITIGRYVIENASRKATIEMSDPMLQEQIEQHKSCMTTIDTKKNEIEAIKNSSRT